MTNVLLLASMLAAGQTAPVEPVQLARVLKPGTTYKYRVVNQLISDERNLMVDTFIPSTSGLEYDIELTIEKELVDGIVEARYQRKNFVAIEGETTERDEVRTPIKPGWDLRIQLSPLNKVLDIKDLTPPRKPARWTSEGAPVAMTVRQDPIAGFISQIYQLAQMIGPLDGSIDFSPQFPVRPVRPGDTWKVTAGFSPQVLKSDKNKRIAVQRADYTYTYRGLSEFNGKPAHKIESELKIDTDLVDFFAQDAPVVREIYTKIPMNLTAKIVFHVDTVSMHTLDGQMTATGGYQIFATEFPDRAIQEGKLDSRIRLQLVSRK